MSSIAERPAIPAQVADALIALDDAVGMLARAPSDMLDTRARLDALTVITRAARRLAGVENELIAGLARDAVPVELGDGLTSCLSRMLRINPNEAAARVRDAEDVATRTAMTGEPLHPRLTATAAGVRRGELSRAHVREIHRFCHNLPALIPSDERDSAEAFLADLATRLTPTELRKAADQLLAYMGHEDDFSDNDRSRRRGFSWSQQDADGMSKGTLWATPALRAELDAIFAAWASPGKCNPDDETPCVDGEPEPQVADRDSRSPHQRRHDALSAVARAMLASGQLGQHNGLPVTVIVSTSLQELQSAAGKAHTGGGTHLPMRDLIRAASHANHYLVIYDGATEQPLWLGRTRRTASPGQRIVLHDKDRGCTFPGCSLPGYQCQAHHATCDWANGGVTNIDDLTFACWAHHPLVTNGGWTTRKDVFGRTEWLPPPGSPISGGTNDFHHPERYLDQPRRDKSPPGDQTR
ncbi:MAG TPA: HNH endonuclease signature motif containing protein [Mycobacterium sp.]|nr:HNH endonuclease signature motif containing protein [Mycobacterium sp.]